MVIRRLGIGTVKVNENWLLVLKNSARRDCLTFGSSGKTNLGHREEKSSTTLFQAMTLRIIYLLLRLVLKTMKLRDMKFGTVKYYRHTIHSDRE